MSRADSKIISICCVIVILSGVSGGCRRRPAETTPDASSVAVQKIRNTVDDLFAYFKMARADKVGAVCEGSDAVAEYFESLSEEIGATTLETVCKRTGVEILDVTADAETGRADVRVTCADGAAVIAEASEKSGFADARELRAAIESAPSVEREMSLSFLYSDSWKLDKASTEMLLHEVFGFLKYDGLIAPTQETSHEPKRLDISVFDSYWVNTSGSEVGGYHSTTEKVCLYVYTWNTYSNVDIGYEFTDASGQVLYTNSFSMKNNTDWIACSWKPSSSIPVGEIYCNLYEPTGELFHTSTVRIFPDDAILPFPVTWLDTSFWADATGAKVDFYPADTPVLEYHAQSLRFYKDMDLFYRFVDEEGNLLYEGKIYVGDSTDAFVFTWNREGLDPLPVKGVEADPSDISDAPDAGAEKQESSAASTTDAVSTTENSSSTDLEPRENTDTTETLEPQEPTFVFLEVTTTSGQPFLDVQIEIREASGEDVPDESLDSQPSEQDSKTRET
ncbi:MAG: hypothetical protein J5636_09050 [Clostridiales bacterium]|nr:hypothetical protein [Clostridiales bacterium]